MLAYNLPIFTDGDANAFLAGIARANHFIKKVWSHRRRFMCDNRPVLVLTIIFYNHRKATRTSRAPHAWSSETGAAASSHASPSLPHRYRHRYPPLPPPPRTPPLQ